MSIHFHWANEEQTLLLLTLEEGWTWAEYLDVVKRLSETIHQLSHTVDAIVEITSRAPFPSGSIVAARCGTARGK
jgi:hypothetical protein